jgi:hypothetical protein
LESIVSTVTGFVDAFTVLSDVAASSFVESDIRYTAAIVNVIITAENVISIQ